MFNKAKRILALLMALVLVFTLAGCGSNEEEISIVYEDEIEYEYVEGESTGNGDSQQGGTQQQGGTTSGQGGGSTAIKDGLMNDNINPEDYRGKTVKFISTIDPDSDESGPVVKNFEKEFGIDVEIIASGLDEHAQKCMGLIAAGQSPDVARSNGDFPAFMGYLQSLDAAKLNYKEEIWNENTFKMSTFNGSPYLCDTDGNIWAEIDIVMYSKSLLKRANAYTPEDYDAQGKWTWDAFFQICEDVKKVTGQAGGAISSYECFYHAMGGTVFKLENGKVTSGLDNNTANIMSVYSKAKKNDVIMLGKSVSAGLMDGTFGIVTLHAWSLKNTGDLKNGKWDDYGFYYLPYADEAAAASKKRPMTGIFRGWGLVRGSKEPVAAGLFLREYLDVNNYDVGGTYISPEAETFFFKVNSLDYSNYNPYLTYNRLNEFITGLKNNEDIYGAMYYDPEQVLSRVDSAKDAVKKGAENINKFIEQYAGAR